ncbi:MAG: DUF2461 family protein [Deltaproteobacteria bacterium]|nr:DUF2461 family protein [Deltaproteobacteria bacterium]
MFRQFTSYWLDIPAVFLEVTPNDCRWGMGFYAAAPQTMEAVRKAVIAEPAPIVRAGRKVADAGFSVNGDVYRRASPYPGMPSTSSDHIENSTRPGCLAKYVLRHVGSM